MKMSTKNMRNKFDMKWSKKGMKKSISNTKKRCIMRNCRFDTSNPALNISNARVGLPPIGSGRKASVVPSNKYGMPYI